MGVHCCPAHIRQVGAGGSHLRSFDVGFSRTPFRLACRTQTVWQCRPVPSLSGPLATFPAPPGSGCPQLHRAAATARRRSPFISARFPWRLVAHVAVDPDLALGLFVKGEHHRTLRRIEVEPDDIDELGLEVLVVRQLERVDLPRPIGKLALSVADRHPTIDYVLLASNPCTLVGAKEDDQSGNLLRRPCPPEWNGIRTLLPFTRLGP